MQPLAALQASQNSVRVRACSQTGGNHRQPKLREVNDVTHSRVRGFFLLCIFSLLLSAACTDGTETRVSAPQTFSLSFHASLGDRVSDVRCEDKLLGLGTTKVGGDLIDLAFYIHTLEFVRADGSVIAAELDESEWQSQNVALLDFQNKSDSCLGGDKPFNTKVSGKIANSDGITALRFTLGIPPRLNHLDPKSMKAPLNAANMFWSWQSGYKAFRFDFSPENGVKRPNDPNFLGTNYFIHLGSTDCTGDPIAGEAVTCGRINQPVIELANFQLGAREVVLDLEELVSGLNLEEDLADTPGCMSAIQDVECESYFQKLGMDLVSGRSSANFTQSAFKLR